MSGNVAGLVAQTLLEGGVVAWAGWEIWSLRTRKPMSEEDAEERPVDSEDR